MSIAERFRHALSNGVPVGFMTCSKDGVPNVSYMSEVMYVDSEHVALSNQFFNKTGKNLAENKHAQLWLFDLNKPAAWVLTVELARSETEGPVFEELEDRINMIAAMQGMEDVFVLKAAAVLKVLAADEIAFDG